MNKAKNKMTIESEFPISLEELAFEVIVKGEKMEDVFEILDREPERAIGAVRRIIDDEIKRERIDDVFVKKISFAYSDSSNSTHAVCYFKVKLKGTEENLRKLCGQGKLFFYEWENKKLSAENQYRQEEKPDADH